MRIQSHTPPHGRLPRTPGAFMAEAAGRLYGYERFRKRLWAEATRARHLDSGFGLVLFELDLNPSARGSADPQLAMLLLALLHHNIRDSDCLGRWHEGGFALLAPSASLSETAGFAVKLRRLIAEYRPGDTAPSTASFGVAEYRPALSVEELIQRTAGALYRARMGGGNRVVADLVHDAPHLN